MFNIEFMDNLFISAVLYVAVTCISLNYPGTPLCNGPGSSVVIATGYGLDGPGIESRWARDLSHTSIPVLGPTQPPVQRVPGLSRE
jgi:hypothetical protein